MSEVTSQQIPLNWDVFVVASHNKPGSALCASVQAAKGENL